MRGSVVRKDSGWAARWDEPGEGGKRRQRRKGGFATKRKADRFLRDQLARLDDGTYATPSTITVAAYLGQWLDAQESRLRPLSLATYRQVVRSYIVPGIGSVRLQELSARQLSAFYRSLERKGLSASTRKVVHAVLRRGLSDAVREGDLNRNPADRVRSPGRSTTRVQAWTASELSRFLDHVADDRLFALWRLGSTSGMRRGELAGLTWRALDLDHARLQVDQQLVPTRGGISFGPPKTARSRRTIALDTETVALLRDHRDAQLLERDLAGDAYEDADLVFCDELGGAYHPQRLTDWFRAHRKAAGIPTGSLHVLRHSAITLMLTNGIPVHVVAARVGDTPTTILNTYAHLLPQSDEIAAERVAAALSG
jgi:integrase